MEKEKQVWIKLAHTIALQLSQMYPGNSSHLMSNRTHLNCWSKTRVGKFFSTIDQIVNILGLQVLEHLSQPLKSFVIVQMNGCGHIPIKLYLQTGGQIWTTTVLWQTLVENNFSKHINSGAQGGLQISSISITWEMVRNAKFQILTYIKIIW